jgi:hypothetical protein
MWHTMSRSREAYVMLLQRDGLWGTWRTRLQLKLLMLRIFAYLTPWILESMLPWHRPARFRDPAWAEEWVRLYDAGEARLVRLDTRRMHLSPAAMLP